MSKLFEMHIVTFGSRTYAHQIARILEDQIRKKLDTSEKQSFFSHRILSRDECVDPYHKSGNLKHLFPAGDSMVAIIDDRGDVWKYSSNCILVKKYHFFADTGVFIGDQMKLDYVLGLKIENFLERRLQTQGTDNSEFHEPWLYKSRTPTFINDYEFIR